jgi:cobalamin biosynthesis protein CobT
MQFTQESKSQLAKLMAAENITVEHRKMSTAMFDLKNRVLYCPIWKDMSGDLYDLLLGHEVGHALETPEEGWHNAVTGATGKFSKNFKGFLNVVEDARIEKKIKRKFPGLRPSMVRAYGQLLERDFFGIKDRNVNRLPFIDKLNLYTKGGYSLGIEFTEEEDKLVKQVEACETWEDVVKVTEAIFTKAKEEMQKPQLKQMAMPGQFDDSDSDEDFGDDFGDYEEDELSEDSQSKNEEDAPESKKKGQAQDSEDAEKSEEESANKIERIKESTNAFGLNEVEPVCETDETYRQNESLLLDASSKEFVYLNFPKPIFSEIITPYKRVHELLEESWQVKTVPEQKAKQEKLFKEFKQKNDRYISLLTKEFEMRKAASKFSKQKISETGDIDVSRIYKYQIDDNIFRKVMRVPKGKSHGLVLLFDRSGSMAEHMENSIEQILILSLFCRKVNIPFVVYGFGNETDAFKIDQNRYSRESSFTMNVNELRMSNVYLREYLNSSVGNAEFSRCVRNLVALADCYSSRYGVGRYFRAPRSESLSHTPMIEAVVAMKTVVEKFKTNNNLDIVNMALIHDGDSDSINSYCSSTGYSYFDTKRSNVVMRDKETKTEYRLNSEENSYDNALRIATFNWFRKTTGVKILGFFIVGAGRTAKNGITRRYYYEDGKCIWEKFPTNSDHYTRQAKADELAAVLKETKFLESKNPGYDSMYLIPGDKDLSIDYDELSVQGTVTASKLKNAFIKMNKKKQVSRVLVNRFIGQIAV